MFTGSIRSRLTAWYGLVLAVTLILFSVFLYYFLSKRLYESVDNSLKVSASVVAKTVLIKYSASPLPGLEYFFEQFLGYGNINKFYRIYDESGNVGSRSRNIDASQFPMTQKAYAKALNGEEAYETFVVADKHPIRIITMPVLRNRQLVNLVQVGTSLEGVRDTLKNLRNFLITAVPVVLLLTTLIGRFMAGRALKPVDKITQTAREIAKGVDLSQRILQPKAQDEVGRLAETFNEMMDRLEKSFSLMRQFSSDASHELRTPLTVLKGQSELVLSKIRVPEDYQETLCSNLEEINYMSKILEDLFFLSQSDEGEIKLDFVQVNLAALIEEICKPAEILAQEKDVKIVIAYLEPIEILGDPHRLRQMVWNLLDNGIKYTPSGGELKISLREEGDEALLIVQDNGIGIPENDLPMIFERFFRVDKARTRSERGSGLGLSICKYIVKAHKGRIEVESQLGVGSRFKLYLPKKPQPAVASKESAAKQ